MLNLGNFRAATCSGLTRRAFVQLGASVPAVLGVAGLPSTVEAAIKGRARSVIFVWLWGAPSHLDTLDPKPDAPSDVRGPFATIETRTPGMRFTELLPRLAGCSDLYSVIRSHKTFAPGHPDAGTWGLTGFAENPAPTHPNFGSIVARHRGSRGSLPPFVMVGRGIPRDVVRIVDGWGGGRLGGSVDPFMISCSAEGRAEIPSLKLLDDLTPTRLADRRQLLDTLDTAQRKLDGAAEALGDVEWSQNFRRAYGLLTQPQARDAFDLSRESESTREQYGFTGFGQSCLLARRLVETGVPYVQVNWSEYVEAMTPNCDFGWDTHIYNFELLQDRHCPIFDRAMSTLLGDLKQRGLLDSTLVVAMGEFGRTPKISKRAARDHWPNCYSSMWAGAGVVGGRVIGASDAQARDPVTNPITPVMVGATIAEFAGMDTQARAEMNVLPGGTVIHELV
jgi:uncharacterized protein (DUF1501 family)